MSENINFSSDPRAPSDRSGEHPSQAPTTSNKPTAPPAGFHEARWLFVGGSVASTVLIGFIAVYQWLPALVPLGLALGMALVLSAVIGFIYCDREPLRAFLFGAGLWALIALPTGLWALAPVRAKTAELLGHKLSALAQVAALRDSAPEVQERACVALGTNNHGVLAHEITDGLFRAPLQGARCITQVAAVDPAGASRLVSAFMSQWERAVKSSNTAQVCAVAPHAAGIAPAKIALPMTECAVTSADHAMARCCGDALAAHFKTPLDYVDALGSPDTLALQDRQRLFTALLPYAFAQVDAARMPLPRLETRLLRTSPAQDWVLALGCDTLLQMHESGPLIDGLEAIGRTQSCEMSADARRDAEAWGRICRDWAAPAERTPKLCSHIDFEAQSEAIIVASALVHDAIRALYASELGKNVLAGAAYLDQYNLTSDSRGDAIAKHLRQEGMRSGMLSASTRQLARRLHSDHAAAIRNLKEAAAEIEGKEVNYRESVQQLLKRNPYRPQASWQEIKGHLKPELRQQLQKQMDEGRKSMQNR